MISSTFLFVSAPFWVSLFNKDPLIISAGAMAVRITVYSYIPLGWSHVYHGAIRGAGNVRGPMLIAIFTQCISRYLFVYFDYSCYQKMYILSIRHQPLVLL